MNSGYAVDIVSSYWGYKELNGQVVSAIRAQGQEERGKMKKDSSHVDDDTCGTNSFYAGLDPLQPRAVSPKFYLWSFFYAVTRESEIWQFSFLIRVWECGPQIGCEMHDYGERSSGERREPLLQDDDDERTQDLAGFFLLLSLFRDDGDRYNDGLATDFSLSLFVCVREKRSRRYRAAIHVNRFTFTPPKKKVSEDPFKRH